MQKKNIFFFLTSQDTFPSSNVLITWFVFPANTQPLENISLPVDSHIESLKIVVTGVTAIRGEFDLFYPNGIICFLCIKTIFMCQIIRHLFDIM